MAPAIEWSTSPCPPGLPEDEVHVWHASLDLAPEGHAALAASLSPEERLRATRFVFDRDRRHFEACRGLLRLLLGRYLDVAAGDCRLVSGPFGKPGLPRPFDHLQFNVSHSGGFALLAFARQTPLGVDLEAHRPLEDLASLARSTFAPGEVSDLLSLPEGDRTRAFFACWTRKEAFIKAVGEGLSFPMDRFEVSLRPGEPAGLLSLQGSEAEARPWSLWDLPMGPDCSAALALRDRARVRALRWDGGLQDQRRQG